MRIYGIRLAVLAVGLALSACNFNLLQNTNAPSADPLVEASPSPRPSPTPSPVSTAAAVFLNIYPYGFAPSSCAFAGNVGQEVAVAGSTCTSVDLTATPKTATGVDAQIHSNAITWTPPEGLVGSGCARVRAHPANPLFNRIVERVTAGACTVPLSATLVEGSAILVGTKTVQFQ